MRNSGGHGPRTARVPLPRGTSTSTAAACTGPAAATASMFGRVAPSDNESFAYLNDLIIFFFFSYFLIFLFFMACYEHRPIFRRAYDLNLLIEEPVRGFSRYHKYSPGGASPTGGAVAARLGAALYPYRGCRSATSPVSFSPMRGWMRWTRSL